MKVNNRRYIVAEQAETGEVWVYDIFDDYRTAVGMIMIEVFGFKKEYQAVNDFFKASDLEKMEGEGGMFIDLEYKRENWPKPHKTTYFILFLDKKEEK